ncbi:hypothetical protein B0H13DRAFT_163023 [Mycena leptocephala]|nr:hypothetical protein B0H13DRAFT_163023 [Mycena leptocephala]
MSKSTAPVRNPCSVCQLLIYTLSSFSNSNGASQDWSQDWVEVSLQFSEFYLERLRGCATSEKIFRELGNTGMANQRRLLMASMVPEQFETPETRQLNPTVEDDPVYQLRHPDPTLVASLTLTDPSLQIRGSWQKVAIKKDGISPRMGFASFIFEGHLYVLGGQKSLSGPWYRDFWYIDLAASDEWRQLPSYPVPSSKINRLVGYSIAVYGHFAYLFTGRKELDVFNLNTLTWSSMLTTFSGSNWPYPNNNIAEYTMQCVDGKIYVFGGSHTMFQLGCTLLMELDVARRTWIQLSGDAVPKTTTYEGPGPRRLACSWVGKDNMIFVLYGEANRAGALIGPNQRADKIHGAPHSFSYEDLWGWDIATRCWTRQRLVGNIPCPRSEMACTYNAALDKVIIFGGYAPSAPSQFDATDRTASMFTYYADTFVYGLDGTTGAVWKHVLTHGFPTYRAQSQFMADPATGRTFLFGGYVSAEYVPASGEGASRCFSDLWELRLDLPGGDFVFDMVNEVHTARVGPWQRCFACGAVGQWKQCGGKCAGQAYFCDARCLRDGWRVHKVKHKCSK